MNALRILLLSLVAVLLAACGGGGGGGGSHTGTYALTVYASDGTTPVDGAWVDVLDDTGAAAGTQVTGTDGVATFHLRAGTYTARVRAQGFETVPPQGVGATPFTVIARQTLSASVTLVAIADPSTVAQVHGNADIAGALVVAEDSTQGIAFSGLTDSHGNYALFNVLPGDYTITAYRAGYDANTVTQTVAALDDLTVDLDMAAHASPSLSGQVTFLAVANGVVDITLVHPVTRDAIPGLSTYNVNTGYVLRNVPDGDYLAWASFANDGYVMDPDWINKNGGFPAALEVTMAGSAITKDFSVTGAVTMDSPTNPPDNIVPAEVDTLTPTFTWSAYPSTQQYVLEVFDMNGHSIWGGYVFDSLTQTSAFNHPDIGTATSKDYNFDGSASEALQDGHTYLWRVYAFKWNTTRGGYVAISSSEDQMGLFTVNLP